MRNIVTPCGEGRVTTRSCEGLAQAGSTFPGRKRIVKSNTESNRVESEGPDSAVDCNIVAHGRAVRKPARLAERERRMLVAASCIYVCFMSACILHSRRCHILPEFFLSLCFFPRPPLHPVLPFSATCTARLFFSLNPVLLVSPSLSSFLSFLRFHPRFANREAATVSTNSEKRTLANRKRGTQGGKRVTI